MHCQRLKGFTGQRGKRAKEKDAPLGNVLELPYLVGLVACQLVGYQLFSMQRYYCKRSDMFAFLLNCHLISALFKSFYPKLQLTTTNFYFKICDNLLQSIP